jgi:hypothetical protein
MSNNHAGSSFVTSWVPYGYGACYKAVPISGCYTLPASPHGYAIVTTHGWAFVMDANEAFMFVLSSCNASVGYPGTKLDMRYCIDTSPVGNYCPSQQGGYCSEGSSHAVCWDCPSVAGHSWTIAYSDTGRLGQLAPMDDWLNVTIPASCSSGCGGWTPYGTHDVQVQLAVRSSSTPYTNIEFSSANSNFTVNPAPSLRMSTNFGWPSGPTVYTANGTHFQPYSSVVVSMTYWPRALCRTTTDQSGAFLCTFQIPPFWPGGWPGWYIVTAQDSAGNMATSRMLVL